MTKALSSLPARLRSYLDRVGDLDEFDDAAINDTLDALFELVHQVRFIRPDIAADRLFSEAMLGHGKAVAVRSCGCGGVSWSSLDELFPMSGGPCSHCEHDNSAKRCA